MAEPVSSDTDTSSTDGGALLRDWIAEIRLCFHQLGAAATELHRPLRLTGAQRAVLESLARQGDQTVPRLAAARPVSRQHIQSIVDSLRDAGLVVTSPNPAHKRSSLVRMTAKGRRLIARAFDRERDILPALAAAFSASELRQATALTERLRRLAAARPWRDREQDR